MEAGLVIVGQGDLGRECSVIIEGEVQIESDDEVAERELDIIARLGVGQFFGGLSLVSDQLRNGSVVAATRCLVLPLSSDAFYVYLAKSATAQRRSFEISQSRRTTR